VPGAAEDFVPQNAPPDPAFDEPALPGKPGKPGDMRQPVKGTQT